MNDDLYTREQLGEFTAEQLQEELRKQHSRLVMNATADTRPASQLQAEIRKREEMTAVITFVKARLDEVEKAAKAATPGPWERPLDTRSKSIVMAARPEDEEPRQYRDGVIPAEFASHKGPTGRYAGQRERVCVVQVPVWSDGSHDRKRSGRDLEYIALRDPSAALREVATWRRVILEYSIPPRTDGVYGGDEREAGFRLALSFAIKAKALEYEDHPDFPLDR